MDDLGLFQGWSLVKDKKTSLNLAFPKIILTAPGYAREVSSRNLDFSNFVLNHCNGSISTEQKDLP